MHAVRFYEDSASLGHLVADFVAASLVCDRGAVIVARSEHRARIIDDLARRGLDVAQLKLSQQLVMLDAEETLAQFMDGDLPDAKLFVATIEPVINLVSSRGGPIRVYGEMVDLLWGEGLTQAALRLEMLWNVLSRTHQYSLLCGYSLRNTYREYAIREICGHHSHVVSGKGLGIPLG